MGENFQSGKTQAIDLDELHVEAANRPSEMRVRGEFELDKWGDDPWASTEESRKKRRWAEDDRWSGDDEDKNVQSEQKWESDEEAMKAGWQAPKRGDVLLASEGWDDWDNFGGAPKELEQEQESKEFGGFRRVQAASQYAQVDNSNYVDGHAQRDDLYRSKEAFGTSGVRERKGDPYADVMQQESAPMPEMKPVSDWEEDVPSANASSRNKASTEEEDMRASAKISNSAMTGDDIPGVTRASIIIFQVDTEPVIFELKKMVTSIGRGLDNMVILNDQYASRRHLTINYVGGRFELYALSVDNLASVNGYPIRHVVLKNNDQVEIGATRIKFVLGPISDEHMKLGAPVNGRPMHLDPPPQEVRSLKTTRKNLILLISVVSVIVFFVIAWLILMFISKDVKDVTVVNNSTKVDVKSAEGMNAGDDSEAPKEDGAVEESKNEVHDIKLEREDTQLLEGMIEAYGLGASRYHSSNGIPSGDKIKIEITTTPSDARIYSKDGSLRGTTPYSTVERVRTKRSEVLTIHKDGYLEKTIDLSMDMDFIESITLEQEAPPEPPKVEKPKPKPKPKPKKPKGGGGSRPGGRIII